MKNQRKLFLKKRVNMIPEIVEEENFAFLRRDLEKLTQFGPYYDGTFHCNVCGQDMDTSKPIQLCRNTYCENQYLVDLVNKMT